MNLRYPFSYATLDSLLAVKEQIKLYGNNLILLRQEKTLVIRSFGIPIFEIDPDGTETVQVHGFGPKVKTHAQRLGLLAATHLTLDGWNVLDGTNLQPLIIKNGEHVIDNSRLPVLQEIEQLCLTSVINSNILYDNLSFFCARRETTDASGYRSVIMRFSYQHSNQSYRTVFRQSQPKSIKAKLAELFLSLRLAYIGRNWRHEALSPMERLSLLKNLSERTDNL